MSPPLSRRTSTTPTWPAVAARIRGVNPVGKKEGDRGLLVIIDYKMPVDQILFHFSLLPILSYVIPFLSRCSMLAPRAMRTDTNSSCPPAQASVSAVSWLLSVCQKTKLSIGTSFSGYDSLVLDQL